MTSMKSERFGMAFTRFHTMSPICCAASWIMDRTIRNAFVKKSPDSAEFPLKSRTNAKTKYVMNSMRFSISCRKMSESSSATNWASSRRSRTAFWKL